MKQNKKLQIILVKTLFFEIIKNKKYTLIVLIDAVNSIMDDLSAQFKEEKTSNEQIDSINEFVHYNLSYVFGFLSEAIYDRDEELITSVNALFNELMKHETTNQDILNMFSAIHIKILSTDFSYQDFLAMEKIIVLFDRKKIPFRIKEIINEAVIESICFLQNIDTRKEGLFENFNSLSKN